MTGWTADSTVIEGSGGPTFWTADGSLAGYVSDASAAPSSLRKITAPLAPALTVTLLAPTSTLIRWLSIFNASTYELYRGGTLIFAGSGNSFTDSGLTANTSYSYTIKSYNARAGAGQASSPTTIMTPAASTTRRFAPGHYIAFNAPLSAAGITNGGTVTGTYPNATVTGALASNAGPAVRSSTDGRTGSLVTAGFVVRHNWSEVEPFQVSYSYTRMDKELAQAKALGVPLVFVIVVRTFNGTVSATFTTNLRNQVTGTLDATSAAAIPSGTYGISFGNGDVRSNVTIAGANVTWSGPLTQGTGTITTGDMNLMSNLPLPAYLQTFAEPFKQNVGTGPTGGWQVWRWSPTIRLAYDNLCAALAARYNDDIYFAGIGTQETAVSQSNGGSGTVYTIGNYTGADQYSAARYAEGLNDEADSIFNHCTKARGFHFQNTLPGGSALLTDYGAYVQPLGAWFGGPDLVTGTTGNANIVTNFYPRIKLYHDGSSPIPNPGPTFESVQHGEWNGTGVGDSPAVLGNLMNYATSSFRCTPANGYTGALDWSPGNAAGRVSLLNVDAIMWDYETGTGRPNFSQDLVPIMKSFPTFGTVTPNP